MAQVSHIEWTDATLNIWRGCTEDSPACTFCYARTLSARNPAVLGKWGRQGERAIAAESYWKNLPKWNRDAERERRISRVFVASLADIFEGNDTMPEASWEPVEAARARLFGMIPDLPNLSFLLLTKRPQNVTCTVPASWLEAWPTNVALGVTIEDQKRFDERWPAMWSIPCPNLFFSMEPLFSPVDIRPAFKNRVLGNMRPGQIFSNRAIRHLPGVTWVLTGGESDTKGRARPSHPDWFRDIRDQCEANFCAFHFKQHGDWLASDQKNADGYPCDLEMAAGAAFGDASYPSHEWEGDYPLTSYRVGKKRAGRLLDGRTWDELPAFLTEYAARQKAQVG